MLRIVEAVRARPRRLSCFAGIVVSSCGRPLPLDVDHRAPGADVPVHAANTMVGHEVLHASAYPFVDIAQALTAGAETRDLPYRSDVVEQVLGGNALRLLERIGALPDGA